MSDTVLGLLACGVSSVFFGSMFVPVRRFSPGDGIVVQFMMCSAIFTVGIFVFLARGMPQFQPFAMLGGLGWAIGNLTAMPIIDSIGLGLGVLIWGAVNCVVGWSVGRYGLFGTHATVPDNQIMNYIGLAFVVIGGALFSQVKVTEARRPDAPEHVIVSGAPAAVVVAGTDAEEHLLGSESAPTEGRTHGDSNLTSAATPKPSSKRIIGLLLSVVAGCCYGTTFVPVIYIQDNPEKFYNPSKDAIDYVLSYFSGIYLTSISVLIIYILYKRNLPYVDPKILGPSMIAGLLWSIAQISWFVANDCLSQAVTFPINAMVPGVCATLWSLFYFKEIKGQRNLTLLGIAVAITLTGAALVGFSK